MAKLLYCASQENMEHEELSMFSELGFDIFSTGSYLDGRDLSRLCHDPLNLKYDYDLVDEFKILFPNHQTNLPFSFPKEFLDKFDIIFFSHFPDWLSLNHSKCLSKPVLYRSFGLSNRGLEDQLRPYKGTNVTFIATTEGEKEVPGYVPRDYFIRASIDRKDFPVWTGAGDYVLTVQKRMASHPHYTRYDVYEQVTSPFKRVLCGFENDQIPWAISNATINQIRTFRKECKVYFSGCSRPAPLTYSFVEALASGCPVVSVGKDIATFEGPDWGKGFDPESIIINGTNGFISSNVDELKSYIRMLYNDSSLSNQISIKARITAFTLFGRDIIIEKWRDLFKALNLL